MSESSMNVQCTLLHCESACTWYVVYGMYGVVWYGWMGGWMRGRHTEKKKVGGWVSAWMVQGKEESIVISTQHLASKITGREKTIRTRGQKNTPLQALGWVMGAIIAAAEIGLHY